eukprot:11303442-Alexandrium_andersonii.AAC.1
MRTRAASKITMRVRRAAMLAMGRQLRKASESSDRAGSVKSPNGRLQLSLIHISEPTRLALI